MKEDFFKFPTTPHLTMLAGASIRGDKVMSELDRDDFLQHCLVVEEKIDGANLGLSFDSEGNIQIQNRGSYLHLPGVGQWKKLGEWLAPRNDMLFEHLSDYFILFGEWCYAQHSIFYDHLPDWFLGFDVYDKRFGRFLSSERREALFRKMYIAQVPVLARGRFTYPEVQMFLATSKFSNQPAEGIYLRFDQDGWLEQRAKLVRPTFIQSVNQHWSRLAIRANQLEGNILDRKYS